MAPVMNRKNFGSMITRLCATILVIVIVAEIALRFVVVVEGNDYQGLSERSEKLGWKTREHMTIEREYKGYGPVYFTSDSHGFRQFGALNTDRPRLMVLGDSQTFSLKVSDGSTYQELIAHHLGMELFAYGAPGYGTLQQYLILEEFYPVIQPDLILIQFCGNDLHNNLFELEAVRPTVKDDVLRPYYIDGKVVLRYPHTSWWASNILRHSALLKFIGVNLRSKDWLAFEKRNKLDRSHPLIQQSIQTTLSILMKIKELAGNSRVVGFLACDGQNYPNIDMDQLFAELSESVGMEYIDAVANTVSFSKTEGITTNGAPFDRHWNALGNKIASEVIIRQLEPHYTN